MHIKQYSIVCLVIMCGIWFSLHYDGSLANFSLLLPYSENIRNHMQVANRVVLFVELSIG